MQELLDDIQKYIKGDWPMNKSIKNSINKALEKEKSKIIDAVDYGCFDWGSSKDAEQYYNQTYNQNK